MEQESESEEKTLCDKVISRDPKNLKSRAVKLRAGLNSYISMRQLKSRVLSTVRGYYQEGHKSKLCFSQLMASIHSTLNKTQRQIVDANLCFLSLLHLANEKSFLLSKTPDSIEDFCISYDNPPDQRTYYDE